jgi:response regulator RpfG family c-di-GMP phosphodiesterase
MFFKKDNFSYREEEDFISESVADAISQIRIVCIVFIVLFAAIGILGEKPVENTAIFFAVRFYILIPLMVILLALSFTPFFVRIGQILMLAAFIIAGVGAAAMLLLEPQDPVQLGMLILVELAGFLFLRLKFAWAIVGGCFILGFYAIFSLRFSPISLMDGIPVLILLMGSVLLGISGNHNINYFERKSFLLKRQNATEKKRLETMMSEKIKEISDSQTVTIFALAKLSESRDKETGNHIERVGKYCVLLASKIDSREYEKRGIIKEDFITKIELASALHDIGKVGIGDSILIKPGRLTADEFELMTGHTLIGSNTLDEVRKKYPNNSFINMGIEITRYHHEKFDGTGYPYGLSGEKIPLSARIMAIADVYDALISIRPYKEAYSHERAVDIITNLSGQQFDPMIIKIFEKSNRELKEIAYGHQHAFRISTIPID